MYKPIARDEALDFLRSVSSCPQSTDYAVVYNESGDIDWIFTRDKDRALNLARQTKGQAFTRRLVEEFVPTEKDGNDA